MRGKRWGALLECGLGRNIPAYAGKTPEYFSPHDYFPEHPRVCGENILTEIHWDSGSGTSPRMRGKRQARRKVI